MRKSPGRLSMALVLVFLLILCGCEKLVTAEVSAGGHSRLEIRPQVTSRDRYAIQGVGGFVHAPGMSDGRRLRRMPLSTSRHSPGPPLPSTMAIAHARARSLSAGL